MIFVYMFMIAGFLAIILYGLSILFNGFFDSEWKISPYECGFQPFITSRSRFEIRFFLIGILFLIFDIEVSLLYPMYLIFNSQDIESWWIYIIFFILLFVGFIYEWHCAGLEWE